MTWLISVVANTTATMELITKAQTERKHENAFWFLMLPSESV